MKSLKSRLYYQDLDEPFSGLPIEQLRQSTIIIYLLPSDFLVIVLHLSVQFLLGKHVDRLRGPQFNLVLWCRVRREKLVRNSSSNSEHVALIIFLLLLSIQENDNTAIYLHSYSPFFNMVTLMWKVTNSPVFYHIQISRLVSVSISPDLR